MAEFLVTTLDDASNETDGVLSLREAIEAANGTGTADSIAFDEALAGGVLTLTQGELVIRETVEIAGDANGDGSGDVTLAGTGFSRLIHLADGAVTLGDLVLTGGVDLGPIYAGGSPTPVYGGGAVYAAGGTEVTIRDSLLTGNQAMFYGYGGAVFGNGAIVNILNSELSDNSGDFGGAVAVRGGTLTVINATLGDNTASAFGGGAFATDTNTYLANATIAGNTALNGGGGVYANGGAQRLVQATVTGNSAGDLAAGVEIFAGNLSIANSIISGNRSDTQVGYYGDLSGLATTEGGNILSTRIFDGAVQTGTTTPVEIFADFANGGGVLAENGSAVRTVLLNPEGPAVDAGDIALLPPDFADADGDANLAEVLAIDGAGNARVQGAAPDLGAVELQAGLTVTTATDEIFNGGNIAEEALDGGGLSLREALAIANATAGTDVITFAEGGILLTQGALAVTDDVILRGTESDAGLTVIDANGAVTGEAAFTVSGATLTLETLAVTGGGESGVQVAADATLITDGAAFIANTSLLDGGAITSSGGAVLLTDTRFEGNASSGDGGAIALSGGTLEITGGVIAGSQATGDGGAIAISGTAASLTRTTIASAESGGDGGGIHATGGTLNLDGTEIDGGSAQDGGGLHSTGTTLTVVGSTFRDNTATGSGGGAHVDGGTLVNTTFLGNEAAIGGGLIATGDGLSILNSTFTANIAQTLGGGLRVDAGATDVTLSNSILLGNHSTSGTGDDLADASAGVLSGPNIIGPQILDGATLIDTTDAVQVFRDTETITVAAQGGPRDLVVGVAESTGTVDVVRILTGGDAEDRGDASLLPLDLLDSDRDANVSEPIQVDAKGAPRLSGKFLDLGADEVFRPTPPGTNANDVISGQIQNDVIFGLEGDDFLNGDEGDDLLFGGVGADTLDGGLGTDTASFGRAEEAVTADLFNLITGTGEAAGDVFINVENLVGSSGNDRLIGDTDDNVIEGRSGSDALFGRAGDDHLFGNLGADTLFGNAGRDVLNGGGGADTFAFFQLSDSQRNEARRDLIEDFELGRDRIDLSRLDADSGLAGDQAFDFLDSGGFTGTAGEVLAFFNAAVDLTFVVADVDGDRISDFQIELIGDVDLSASDFLL